MSKAAKPSPTKSYYLPGDPSRTPLTHEEFCDIMRPFWKQRKQLQRAGECNAPARHVCMCDCADCPYRRCGNTIPMETLLNAAAQLCPQATFTLELMDSEPSVKWLQEKGFL